MRPGALRSEATDLARLEPCMKILVTSLPVWYALLPGQPRWPMVCDGEILARESEGVEWRVCDGNSPVARVVRRKDRT
jgi:hypothetical protein